MRPGPRRVCPSNELLLGDDSLRGGTAPVKQTTLIDLADLSSSWHRGLKVLGGNPV